MASLHRFLTSPGGRLLPLTAAVVLQASCATGPRAPRDEPQRLVIENVSDDVIRVSIDLGNRELLLGRVDPMSRAALRIRTGALPPGAPAARIRVVPVGTPSLVVSAQESGRIGLHSDPHRIEDLIGSVWRYSGSRVLWVGPAGREHAW